MTTSTPSNSTGTNSNNTSNSNSHSHSHNNNHDSNHRQGDGERATSAAATLYNGHSPTTAAAAAQAAATSAAIGSTNRVMQADEDFNIRFVNLVRTHRCLYDKKVPEYRNRDNQEKAWALISKETRESVIHCKERWRNLRACLSRYIKQQSGSEPQHKPYYLTEHMAFLLPFLKSTRNSLEGSASLASLYQFSQQHLQLQQQHQHQQEHMYCNNNNVNSHNNNLGLNESLEMKQSLSENDDEETIDAFDPAITATLGLQRALPPPGSNMLAAPASPAHSETASANSLQNFIPDVQLAESGQDLIYNDTSSTPMHHQPPHAHSHVLHGHHPHHLQQHAHFEPSAAKRIKTECDVAGNGVAYFGGLSAAENTDMEFFRSILPDIAALTPQQRRKFKIGILELIDEVVDRYPSQERLNGTVPNGSAGSASGGGSAGNSTSGRQQRRSSGRDYVYRS